MPGIEMLGLLEDIAHELEMFGVCCRFEDDGNKGFAPHGWERTSEGPEAAEVAA